MRARLAAPLLVALLALPGAGAFAAPQAEVALAYALEGAPVVVGVGQLEAVGVLHGMLVLVNASGARVGPIPELTMVEGDGETGSMREVRGATVVVHSGSLLWMVEGAPLTVEARVPYGFALAIPQVPTGEAQDEGAPGLLLAAPALVAQAQWPRGEARLVPADAVVSVFDAGGSAIAGWDRRAVNEGAAPGGDGSQEGGVVLLAEGAFGASLAGDALFAGLDPDAPSMRLDVRPSTEDGFVASLGALRRAFAQVGGDGGAPADDPFAALAPLGPLLNGVVLAIAGPEGGAAPVEARVGGDAVETGGFTLLRSRDLAMTWERDALRVQGTSTVAVTQAGFHVDPPATVFGFLPVASLVLWLLAAGAIASYVVRRPPEGKPRLAYRAAGAAVGVVTLLVVFALWDRSFAATFGTSVLTILARTGLASDWTQVGLVFALEMVPWGLAALLFALPLRIAAGIGLRHLGHGKSWRGAANAIGLVGLAVFGPAHALWLVNVLVTRALDAMGGL